jgi:hypothetical protein
MRRLLTKISVDRCARISSSRRGWMAVQIDCRAGPCEAGPLGTFFPLPEARHVFDRNLDGQLELLLFRGVDDGDGPVVLSRAASGFDEFVVEAFFTARASMALRSSLRGGSGALSPLPNAAEEARDLVEWTLCGREADPLQRPFLASDRFEPLQREREMCPALGRHERVDFVHDQGVHRSQGVPRVRGQEQVQRFRRGDQDVGRFPHETRALDGRRVARTHGDGGRVKRIPSRSGAVGDTGQGGAEVPLDVHGERLQG